MRSVDNATMYGCEIVWPAPIGSGSLRYADEASVSGTKRCRGTSRIAAMTRSAKRSRPVSRRVACAIDAISATIWRRSRANNSSMVAATGAVPRNALKIAAMASLGLRIA